MGNKTETGVGNKVETRHPTMPVIFNQNQTTNQTTFEMTLSTNSTDANFANYQLKGGQYTDWTDTTETSVFRFTLTQQGQNVLSIRGKDKAGNIGSTASVTITLDTVTPVMSDIKADAGIRSVVISWKTSEPTYGKVDFGLNEDYGNNLEDSAFTTDHSVSANELTAGSTYHYRIQSSDGANNIFSTDLTFITYKIKAISAGHVNVCALTTSGKVKCWGETYFQSGRSVSPADVPGLSNDVTAITAGGGATCALTTTGGVKCWSWSSNGPTASIDVPGLSTDITTIDGSGPFCEPTISGGVKCWDVSHISNGTFSMPVDVPGLSTGIKAITVGGGANCALTNNGGVKCWGVNSWGQLGDGTTTDRLIPVDVAGLTTGIKAIAIGGGHTCALTTTGGIKCWGANTYGQLGDGTTTNRLTPVDVAGLTTGIKAIAIGGGHTCALTTTGGIKCWGLNSKMGDTDYRNAHSGQLGDGTTTNRLTPVDVSGLTTGVASVTVGDSHSCAITTSGGVMCWGNNKTSQCGCAETYCLTPSGISTGNATLGNAIGVSVVDTPYGNTYIQGYTCVIYSYGGISCRGFSPGVSWH